MIARATLSTKASRLSPSWGSSLPADSQQVLAPLRAAQNDLEAAQAGLSEVGDFWSSAQNEVSGAGSQAERAQSEIYKAESDTEETDHSDTGRWASSYLDSIDSSLSRLQWNASTPSSELYGVQQQIASAKRHLDQVDGPATNFSFQQALREAVRSVDEMEAKVHHRIHPAQDELKSNLDGLDSTLSEASAAVTEVENDREGVSVAYSAREAQDHLRTLQRELGQVGQDLRFASSDLTQARSQGRSANQSIQEAIRAYGAS